MWVNFMFSDQSGFFLHQLDCRVKVQRRYRCSLGLNSSKNTLDDRPHRVWFIRDYLQNLGVEMKEWPASSPDLNPTEYSCDQLLLTVHARVTNTATLDDLQQMLF